jgi:hypothetical protein
MSGERLITPEYRDWLKDLKLRVRQAQVRAEPSLRQGYGGQAGRVSRRRVALRVQACPEVPLHLMAGRNSMFEFCSVVERDLRARWRLHG